MTSETVPPAVLAAMDQERARVRAIVQDVRDHQAVCGVGHTGGCVGHDVYDAIRATPRRSLEGALMTALCELARQPAQPTTVEGIGP